MTEILKVQNQIIDSRHPNYYRSLDDWNLFRRTWEGGTRFRDEYLVKFSQREFPKDFEDRSKVTPIPRFAGAAIADIRNSIFQRMGDIVRRNGSPAYTAAIEGLNGGVDLHGTAMNSFIGIQALDELLVMGKVGIYVDAPAMQANTLADAAYVRPYIYRYQIEDILAYSYAPPGLPSQFRAVLLRDTTVTYDQQSLLPGQEFKRYRHLWINQETGLVNLQFYNEEGHPVDVDGNPAGAIELQLTAIPFVLLDIGESLIKDVCHHQVALLNLTSSDVNYARKSNIPFYTEQRDLRAVGSHLKQPATDGTASEGGQAANERDLTMGATQGRAYDLGAERPGFINPSSEPLQASLSLQAKLEADIRKLVNLAVQTLASRASAESKQMDNLGLEAGLSYIGLVLEAGEKRIAEYWAAYENVDASKRQVAMVKYPDRYSLKTDLDRITEADKLSDLMFSVPGRTVKKEIAKTIVTVLLGGKISIDKLDAIYKEIDTAPYTTSDPETIIAAKEAGLAGEQTASIALGFEDDEYLQAREDHIRRATEILKAQASVKTATDAGARGVDDLSADSDAGKREKAESRNTDLKDTTKEPVRGEGK